MKPRRLLGSTLIVICSGWQTLYAQIPAGPGDWPQWRGANRDGVSMETGLLKEWPTSGPSILWEVNHVGVGYSSIAVKDGRIFTQGDLDGVEHVIALDAKTGSVLWAVQPEPVARQLTERIARELKQMDRDGDGVVDQVEAISRLGLSFSLSEKPSEGDAKEIAAARAVGLMKHYDKDGDGRLSFAEAGSSFRDAFARMDTADENADDAALAKQRAEAIVAAADEDKDGQISRRELRNSEVAFTFGRADRDPRDDFLSVAEIEADLARFEKGRDGLITADELAQYLARTYPGTDGILTEAELRRHVGGYRNSYGDGPRGTPTVDGDRVYAEGGNGDVTCLDVATGKTIWHINLATDLGGGRPGWGYSESPLVLGPHLIVTPGGSKGTVAALDKLTGAVVWRSEGHQDAAQYSSPVLAELSGVRQIVQFGHRSVFGVAADSGKLLWTYGAANNGTANVCTPVPHQDHVFASSGYGTGGGLVKITSGDDGQKAEEVYFERRMANHHGGIVRVGDTMYGFNDQALIAMDYLTGKVHWTDRSVGKGSLVYADGMLYCLGEQYRVGLVEATPEGYREHGRFQIDGLGRPSWAHPVVAGGRLYLRNQGRLAAYDVSGGK
jgi:Ca2+-binding EF-hand superfamily protein